MTINQKNLITAMASKTNKNVTINKLIAVKKDTAGGVDAAADVEERIEKAWDDWAVHIGKELRAAEKAKDTVERKVDKAFKKAEDIVDDARDAGKGKLTDAEPQSEDEEAGDAPESEKTTEATEPVPTRPKKKTATKPTATPKKKAAKKAPVRAEEAPDDEEDEYGRTEAGKKEEPAVEAEPAAAPSDQEKPYTIKATKKSKKRKIIETDRETKTPAEEEASAPEGTKADEETPTGDEKAVSKRSTDSPAGSTEPKNE